MTIKKILVADDSKLLHHMYDLIFRRYTRDGTEVLHAMNGKEALSRLHEHGDVDIILLDINMPVMSGVEFLRHCRDENVYQNIPVIIISSEGREEDTMSGLRQGAKGYVTKPFRPDDLYKIIKNVMSAAARAGGKRSGVTETLCIRAAR